MKPPLLSSRPHGARIYACAVYSSKDYVHVTSSHFPSFRDMKTSLLELVDNIIWNENDNPDDYTVWASGFLLLICDICMFIIY